MAENICSLKKSGSSGGSTSGVALYAVDYIGNGGNNNLLSVVYFADGSTRYTSGTISDDYINITYSGYGNYTVKAKVDMTLSAVTYRNVDYSSALGIVAQHYSAGQQVLNRNVNNLAVFIHSLD